MKSVVFDNALSQQERQRCPALPVLRVGEETQRSLSVFSLFFFPG